MIYLFRHGVTEGSGQRRFIGQTDTALAVEGREQARHWHAHFLDTELESIYCSDLQRSEETARIIAGDRQISIKVMPELREIFLGKWEGLSMEDVRRRFPDEWRRRGENLADFPPPEGESFRDLQNRAVPVFEAVAGSARGHQVIVAHAGVNRVILCHLLGMHVADLFRLGQDYGALTIVDYGSNSSRVLSLNIYPGQFNVFPGP